MGKFQIRSALAGGFGGCENAEWEDVEAKDLEEALTIAYEAACELYVSYEGSHGLRDVAEIIDEEECDEKEAELIYAEEREGWLDYEARAAEPTSEHSER